MTMSKPALAASVFLVSIVGATAAPYLSVTAPTLAAHKVSNGKARSAGTFHVVYKSDGAADVVLSLELLVSPSRRHITGALQMTKPLVLRSHIEGSYTEDPTMRLEVKSISGFPGLNPCMLGHGPAVWENTRIALTLKPNLRAGVMRLSYAADQPNNFIFQHRQWIDATHIKLDGGAPEVLKDVVDIFPEANGSNRRWNGRCFD